MQKSDQQFCFKHPGGEDIYLFTLRNSKGTEVRITNYGATITSFVVLQKDGKSNDIVLGFDTPEEYLSRGYLKANPYFGAAVGRYGNRIKHGKFSVDGKHYQVKTNLGTEHLHGGDTGFDKRVWHCDSFFGKVLELSYNSPDGEEQYPGNLVVSIRFELNEENELSHEFTATTDQPTPVNLTHHTYFNFNNGIGKIDDHIVKINASNTLAQDDTLTVTGEILPVTGTIYDFRQPRAINANWNADTGFDQSFVTDQIDPSRPTAEAWSEQSGIKLQLFTTEPIVHLYTGISIPSIAGKDQKTYGPFSGFCLETQIHPNAINIHSFPDTVLRPGKTYRHKTVYRILN